MRFKTIGATFVAMGIAIAGSAYAAGPQQSQQGSGAFCLQKQGGVMDCKYASAAECNKNKMGSDTCIQNPRQTTGSATQSPAAKSTSPSKSK
jgi:hypothetical protein